MIAADPVTNIFRKDDWPLSFPSLPEVVGRYFEAANFLHPVGMRSCLTKDVRVRCTLGDHLALEISGAEQFEQVMRAHTDQFVIWNQTVIYAIDVGGTTSVESQLTVTAANGMANGWKTGQSLQFEGRSLFRLEGGSIAEIVERFREIPIAGYRADIGQLNSTRSHRLP